MTPEQIRKIADEVHAELGFPYTGFLERYTKHILDNPPAAQGDSPRAWLHTVYVGENGDTMEELSFYKDRTSSGRITIKQVPLALLATQPIPAQPAVPEGLEISEDEIRGIFRGKCVPEDSLVGESVEDYFVRLVSSLMCKNHSLNRIAMKAYREAAQLPAAASVPDGLIDSVEAVLKAFYEDDDHDGLLENMDHLELVMDRYRAAAPTQADRPALLTPQAGNPDGPVGADTWICLTCASTVRNRHRSLPNGNACPENKRRIP